MAPINVTISTGTNKEKAFCAIIKCDNCSNCDLYKQKQCVRASILNTQCPYGNVEVERGYTKRARSHFQWVNKRQKDYADYLNVLSGPVSKMAKVGDYVYLPYSHMNMNKSVPFMSHSQFLIRGMPFLKVEDFTVDNIVNICNFRPTALMGGEIKSYQKEVVPTFLQHLSESDNDLFMQLIESHPKMGDKLKSFSHVGRHVLLHTLNLNIDIRDIHGGTWFWDGKYLTSTNSHASFMLVNNPQEVRIKPRENSVVKVCNDTHVNENTKFIN